MLISTTDYFTKKVLNMILNLKKLKMYTGIDRKETIEQDVRLAFANLIYANSDIRGLRLAEKIYHSDGDEDFSDAEVAQIKEYAERLCTAMMIDAINILINND